MIDLDKLEARLESCVVIHLVGPNCNMSCEPEHLLSLITELKSSRAENERLRAVLELINNRNRARGYPTGGEWEDIISWVKVALAQSEETK